MALTIETEGLRDGVNPEYLWYQLVILSLADFLLI